MPHGPSACVEGSRSVARLGIIQIDLFTLLYSPVLSLSALWHGASPTVDSKNHFSHAPTFPTPDARCFRRPSTTKYLSLAQPAHNRTLSELPTMSYSRHYRPALKDSVDLQLQTAFSDGNWQSVVRLADKRAKSLKDPYYDVGAPLTLCRASRPELTFTKGHQGLCRVSAGLAGRQVCRFVRGG